MSGQATDQWQPVCALQTDHFFKSRALTTFTVLRVLLTDPCHVFVLTTCKIEATTLATLKVLNSLDTTVTHGFFHRVIVGRLGTKARVFWNRFLSGERHQASGETWAGDETAPVQRTASASPGCNEI